ncbi:MAG TPA: DUF5668 domain-containing protein [Candidatus Acidoferrum sp.]|nr:DUF5668 domain-containing protein [Candidatus Acidoferrum sp.]
MDNDEKGQRRPPASNLGEEIRESVLRNVHDRIDARLRRRMKRRESYGGLIPGAVILAIGTIFLLDSLGYLHARSFFQFWPLILVVLGAAKIARHESRVWGIALLLLGVFLQLNELGIAHFTWNQFWPVLLIAAGLMAMWSAIQARVFLERTPGDNSDPRTTLDESTIFGGIEKRLNSREFRGGRLQAIFGGIELDLRDADLAEDEAVIYTNAVFGGIEIRVPETWYVAARGQGVFGGFSDSTRFSGSADGDKPKKTLIVLGTALFGGVEIRN